MSSMETDTGGQGDTQPPAGTPLSGGPPNPDVAMEVSNVPAKWAWDDANQCFLHSACCSTCNNFSTHQREARLSHEKDFIAAVAQRNDILIPRDQYSKLKLKLETKITDLCQERDGLRVEIDRLDGQIISFEDTTFEYQKKYNEAQEMLDDTQSSEYSKKTECSGKCKHLEATTSSSGRVAGNYQPRPQAIPTIPAAPSDPFWKISTTSATRTSIFLRSRVHTICAHSQGGKEPANINFNVNEFNMDTTEDVNAISAYLQENRAAHDTDKHSQTEVQLWLLCHWKRPDWAPAGSEYVEGCVVPSTETHAAPGSLITH